MQLDLVALTKEANRQISICNACRFCSSYCAVFPAVSAKREHQDHDMIQLANLCHNCRGCYYACQYTPPHEFAINLPGTLAELRHASWIEFAKPKQLAKWISTHAAAWVSIVSLSFLFLIGAMMQFPNPEGLGFYGYLSHNVMVAIFAPAFLLPLALGIWSVHSYWKFVGGGMLHLQDIFEASRAVATMRNLKGGQELGCNFEKKDRYSNGRRHAHQAVLFGFLLCFASTSVATIMHYGLDWPAPYGIWTLPKIFGISGGVLLTIGSLGLWFMRSKADPELGSTSTTTGDQAFVMLTGLVGLSGLMLYAATGTSAVSTFLAIHLSLVMAFFVTLPFSKMMHGFYRMAALLHDAQRKRRINA